jgi:serine/threonine-protein kinase
MVGRIHTNYDVSPDGDIRNGAAEPGSHIVVIRTWPRCSVGFATTARNAITCAVPVRHFGETARVAAGLAGRYELQRELGRGGWRPCTSRADVRHNRPVAIKVLVPDLSQS